MKNNFKGTIINAKIENRIVPLFSNPLYLKKISLLRKEKKNNLNSPSLNTNNIINKSRVHSFPSVGVEGALGGREILSLFLKGFSIYNFKLNQYLITTFKKSVSPSLKTTLFSPSFLKTTVKPVPVLSSLSPFNTTGPVMFCSLLPTDKNNLSFRRTERTERKEEKEHNRRAEEAVLQKAGSSVKRKYERGNEESSSYFVPAEPRVAIGKKLDLIRQFSFLNDTLLSVKKEETLPYGVNKKTKEEYKGGVGIKENKQTEMSADVEEKKTSNNTSLLSCSLLPAFSEGRTDGFCSSILEPQDRRTVGSVGPKDREINKERTNTKNRKENLNINSKPFINLYLKEITKFNVNHEGLFIHYSKYVGYQFNKQNSKFYKNIYKLLAASFKSMYCLISKPVFIFTPDKVIIQLFYFLFIPNILKLKKFYKHNYSSYIKKRETERALKIKKRKNLKKQYSKFRKIKLNVRIKLRKLSNITLTKVFSNKFKILCISLNKLFKNPVEFDLIRLHYPYNDSNILVNLLGIMINKIKLRIILRRLFEKTVIKNKFSLLNSKKVNIIPAFLSGMSIKVGGRLLTHKVVPRQTVKSIRRGATADGKINFKDIARYTHKNKRGAFTITVKSGQNFFPNVS